MGGRRRSPKEHPQQVDQPRQPLTELCVLRAWWRGPLGRAAGVAAHFHRGAHIHVKEWNSDRFHQWEQAAVSVKRLANELKHDWKFENVGVMAEGPPRATDQTPRRLPWQCKQLLDRYHSSKRDLDELSSGRQIPHVAAMKTLGISVHVALRLKFSQHLTWW